MTLFPEFPDYDDNITIPNGWVDNSWHNDICPHLEKPVNPVKSVAIWCDYKEYARRELGSMHRFTVAVQDDIEKTDLGFFDDFDNALLFANALHTSLVTKKETSHV